MEYKPLNLGRLKVTPHLIIHGGAGNITPATLPPDLHREYIAALLTIVSKSHAYMHTPLPPSPSGSSSRRPTSLSAATYAVTLLEDNPLFNSGHGAVFTRDGVNELEASVMVSRGRAKRGVGVAGLRRVRNPIRLARAVLDRGERDLGGKHGENRGPYKGQGGEEEVAIEIGALAGELDVPSAQGHTLIFGAAAEQLAERYGLEMVDQKYFYTQKRWDEHVRALQREKNAEEPASATWSLDEFLPQGTCGAVALDEDGVICVATSTGGMTNKLTGRIGDTPVVGAGFWAEEWEEGTNRSSPAGGAWDMLQGYMRRPAETAVTLSDSLRGWMADCLPTPFLYQPVTGSGRPSSRPPRTTRSMAVSGTGNGDSFMRLDAARTVAAMARFARLPAASAVARVAGPRGELQKSADKRWGMTGEGEGGMIGIESVVIRGEDGRVIGADAEIIQAHNCGGMFRAWIDDKGKAVARIWRGDETLSERQCGKGVAEK